MQGTCEICNDFSKHLRKVEDHDRIKDGFYCCECTELIDAEDYAGIAERGE